MARTETRLDSLETHVTNMGDVLQSMKTSIGQLANALKDNNGGQFPSNTEINPKEQCNVITLRSGKQASNEEDNRESKASDRTEKSAVEEKKVEEKESEPEPKPMYKPPLPYPQSFKKKTLDEQISKFLEIFKKLHINILFADSLLQMLNYAKFLKKVMSKKQKLEEFETVNLTEEYMEDDANMPLILGRPFLDTAEAKIDVKKGELSMGVDGEKIIFNVFKEANNPSMERVLMIDHAKRRKSCYKVERKVELPRENDPKVPQKKKRSQSTYKRVVEYVWRVKEKNKSSNKAEPG
ncbi:uncharacterized protein [Henckelia pumila]|uniref:uncharacterized protein n=1 Tax=Henckelia pumila TaxID=405737 RepID=UPI003C6E4541